MPNLWIPMTPVAKERPRFNRNTGAVYTPKRTHDAEKQIREAWEGQGFGQLDGDIGLTVGVWRNGFAVYLYGDMPVRPTGLRGDLDNYLKLVQDGLNGVAYSDDKQITSIEAAFVDGEHP